ncbi:hypothetical protein M406DRAFT_72625 [Cryphonectria parasitica EP155]|uniref:Uncharacterized protein n=1 Tax=Cryphonectria parasitica (strain ATCC 38755 / EP155) TaxID=660469 RepID=A0A9P4XXF3_CRYP1|nr:uncharacterized protein M406DRAFT_72625 [Cryphonectria parasitica EP155]KAF3762641.1 hypothetical protein M406DRAFT_72625 [Cryphonectria parasitica EP155]
MANGLDKLERLFSNKKKAAHSRHTSESYINGSIPDPRALPQEAASPCQFPQSPFIRPKANVMQPRNELLRCSPRSIARTNSSRSKRFSKTSSAGDSLKETMSDRRRPNSYSTTASFHIPSRTSSLLSRRNDRFPGGLVQLQLPRETAFADGSTQSKPSSEARTLPRKGEKPTTTINTTTIQRGLLDALPIYPAARVETPPPSDQDEISFPSLPQHGHNPSTVLLQLTPEPSPEMTPQRDSPLSEPKSSPGVKRETASAPSRRATDASAPLLLDDDWRDPYIHDPQSNSTSTNTSTNTSPNTKVVFRDPPVEDFLSMTYEDLAEVKMTYPSDPPPTRAPPPPVLPPNALSPLSPVSSTSPMSPISPVLPLVRSPMPSSSPAMAYSQVAAWEAARIAKKFDFDVVYVANFWPARMNHLHNPRKPSTMAAVSDLSPTSAASSANSSFSHSIPASLLSSPASDRHTTATRSSTPRNSLQGATSSAHMPSELFAQPLVPNPDCCPESGRPVRNSGPMRGCLLAGYGLETIAAPFKLNTRVHKKILRTVGWIEHRNSAAKENEFARGYARSFYTGSTLPFAATPSTPRRSSAPDASVQASFAAKSTPSTPPPLCTKEGPKRHEIAQSKHNVNRGLVFVAYRRPRGPSGSVNSSTAELEALGKEAEALVELILDFHVERRRWEAAQEARRASG